MRSLLQDKYLVQLQGQVVGVLSSCWSRRPRFQFGAQVCKAGAPPACKKKLAHVRHREAEERQRCKEGVCVLFSWY